MRALSALVLLACAAQPAVGGSPRVVTLAPHLTELVYAAGGGERLVGVVAHSDYPAEAGELPRIGDAFRFDLETITTLEAELALAWEGGTPAAMVSRLESLGVEVMQVSTRSLADIAEALRAIGRRLDSRQQAERAAGAFEAQLAELTGPAPGDDRVRVFYQVSARPLYTLGGRHVINEVFERCGAVNIFADLDTEAAAVDIESVIAREPELIIAGAGEDSADALARWRKPVFAGQKPDPALHRVDPSLLVRPTPRIIEGIRHVCELVGETAAAER